MNLPEESQRVIEEMGGKKKIIAELSQFRRNCALVAFLWENLLERYPNKWIAYLKNRVIASADSLEELLGSIPEENRGSTVIKFMDTNPRPLILAAA